MVKEGKRPTKCVQTGEGRSGDVSIAYIRLAFGRIEFDEFRRGALLPQLIEPGISQDGEEPLLHTTSTPQTVRPPNSANISLLH